MVCRSILGLLVIVILTVAVRQTLGNVLVGSLPNLQHGISGQLRIIDSKTLQITGFSYDGQGPGAFLYYYRPGETINRNGGGEIIPLSSRVGQTGGRYSGSFLRRRFNNEDLTVTMPDGTNVCDIGTLTIWCQPFRAFFTSIVIPRDKFANNGEDPCTLAGATPPPEPPTTPPKPTTEAPKPTTEAPKPTTEAPKPTTEAPKPTTEAPKPTTAAPPMGVKVGDFINIIHDIRGTVIFNDERTITINDFAWDGLGIEVFLYFYSPGVDALRRGESGTIIPVTGANAGPDGALVRRVFNGETITATLPDGYDVCDIGTLTVWCKPFDTNFGHLPVSADDVFESQNPCKLRDGDVADIPIVDPTFDNCIPLHETLQLSWKVDSDNSQVRFQLCGCQSADVVTNQYMGFGLSGSTSQTLMFGADPTITWVDTVTGEANAVDYHLSAYTQCRAGVGACPDTLDSSGTCTNDVMDVTGSVSEGQQCVSFTKSFSTSDSTCDIPFDPTNENQYIVWGVGGLGETAFRHFIRAQITDDPIHLGRTPKDECVNTQLVCSRNCQPFMNKRIIANENKPLRVRIGPAGNERGYMGITGRAGWGINFFIDGTLIPELVVERGKTYTFLIETGNDDSILTNYHPFYITDSISGGRLQNAQEEKDKETVYAGFDENGLPTAVGELCSYQETLRSERLRTNCASLSNYTNSLELSPASCRNGGGNPGRLEWRPDENTPDLVYYQCATHLNLGWKIIVTGTVEPTTTEPTELTTEEPTPEIVPTNIKGFCSVVVWDYPQTDNLIGYDIRFIGVGTPTIFKRQQSSRTYYALGESEKSSVTSNSFVQVRVWHSNGVGTWGSATSLGCSDPPPQPTCPPCDCDAVTTSSPPQRIRPGLYFKNKLVPNNSSIPISDIGEGEDALICETDKTECCRTAPNRRGQFYYPNGVQVPISLREQALYRNRGDQLIRLNRRRDDADIPTGMYCCEIPDASDMRRRLCVNLI